MAEADDERIDANNDDDIRRWAKTLGVENVAIIDAVRKVGPKLGDVRRYFDERMAGGQADA